MCKLFSTKIYTGTYFVELEFTKNLLINVIYFNIVEKHESKFVVTDLVLTSVRQIPNSNIDYLWTALYVI